MCGIFGYIGEGRASDKIYSGLEKLEYRGYDSAGITILNSNRLITEKKASTSNKNAIQFLSDVKINGNMGRDILKLSSSGINNKWKIDLKISANL